MSYYTLFFIGIAPFSHFTAGWLAEHAGVQLTFIAFGAIALLAGVAFWFQMRSFAEGLRPIYESRGITR
jgi:hypothetical protein